jgi:hypothetical protein
MKTILIQFDDNNLVKKVVTNGEDVTVNLLDMALCEEGE